MRGQRFGRWTVLSAWRKGDSSHPKIKCKCRCGTVKWVDMYSVTHGGSQSCGCLIGETASRLRATHGHSRVGKMTPTYRSWQLMNRRCRNPNSNDYPEY